MAAHSFPVHTLLISICMIFLKRSFFQIVCEALNSTSPLTHFQLLAKIRHVWGQIEPAKQFCYFQWRDTEEFENQKKKNPEVTTGIEQKGKKSPPREAHACSCTAHARSDSKYNVYFVTKGYSFRVCRCYCEATENFCWNIFWVNTTKTRIMDARPFRGRIVLLGWEDYRNLIKSLKNLQQQEETLGNKRSPFSLTPK